MSSYIARNSISGTRLTPQNETGFLAAPGRESGQETSRQIPQSFRRWHPPKNRVSPDQCFQCFANGWARSSVPGAEGRQFESDRPGQCNVGSAGKAGSGKSGDQANFSARSVAPTALRFSGPIAE